MDARRSGEVAFGTLVAVLGAGLLALAFGRLSAPVDGIADALAAPASAPVVASRVQRSQPVAPVVRPVRHVIVKRPSVARPAPRAVVTFAPPHRVAYAGTSAGAVPFRRKVRPATPVLPARIAHDVYTARRIAPRHAPAHRYGIAYVRLRPRAEATPEPPIGYEERPALLTAPAPNLAGGSSSP